MSTRGYRRLPLRAKVALSRRMAPVIWQCMACNIKVTTRDQAGHAARHGGRCGFRAVAKACSRCGEEWRPFAGSKLNMHARCRFTVEEADALLERFLGDPSMTLRKMAAELDIAVNVLRTVLSKAKKRRRCELVIGAA